MVERALITGASGFVGGFLAEHLMENGQAVLGCSPDGQWCDESTESLAGRVELVAWDMATPNGLSEEACRLIERFRPDALYHLAAISVPEDCGASAPAPLAESINVGGTRQVLELAGRLPSRPRVLLVSTSHVYAPAAYEASPLDENTPLGPNRGYGRTKLAAEDEVRRAVRQGICDAVIVRAFQHTGPCQNARMMLPQWARQFAAGGSEPVEVYTRDAHIDLTDVRDVVHAYRLLMEQGHSGEVYNVGSGVSRRSGDLLDMLRELADPRRTVVELRPGFKQDPIADISRLAKLTGWRPEIPPRQTVADTLAYWRAKLAQGVQR